jgi:hypothetical protein
MLACGLACGAGATGPAGPTETEAGVPACTVSQVVGCPDPANPPSYANDVAPLFKIRCAPCHFSGGVVASMYDFSTYTNIVDAQTSIIGQLSACNMPPTRGDPKYGIAPGTVQGISVAQAATIIQWIGCGAPDN